MDIKLIFSLVALALLIAAIIPYIRDTLKGVTKPHLYTWIVWTGTGIIATSAYFYGNGGYPAYTSAVGTFLCVVVALLSLKYGTRDITLSDTVALCVCAVAGFVWLGLNNPLLSAIIGISIDIVGYWPTVRKTYAAPWSESLFSWGAWTLIPICSIAAVASYNAYTLINSVPILFVNAVFIAFMLYRRRLVPQPV